MKTLIIIAVHILIFFVSPFWWANMAIAFFIALIMYTNLKKHLQWVTVAALTAVTTTIIDFENNHILSKQMAGVFGLPSGLLLILLSTIIAAVGVMLGQWLGLQFRYVARQKHATK